jgi:hypothetical protein
MIFMCDGRHTPHVPVTGRNAIQPVSGGFALESVDRVDAVLSESPKTRTEKWLGSTLVGTRLRI